MNRRLVGLLMTACIPLALTACGDPSQYPGTDGQRTRQGALAGAAVGAVLGGTRESGSDRLRNAAVGAAVGAAAGAAIGYNLDRQAAELRNDFGNGQIDVINTGYLIDHQEYFCAASAEPGRASTGDADQAPLSP